MPIFYYSKDELYPVYTLSREATKLEVDAAKLKSDVDLVMLTYKEATYFNRVMRDFDAVQILIGEKIRKENESRRN